MKSLQYPGAWPLLPSAASGATAVIDQTWHPLWVTIALQNTIGVYMGTDWCSYHLLLTRFVPERTYKAKVFWRLSTAHMHAQ